MEALVQTANIQDRDGGVLLMVPLFGMHPFPLTLSTDGEKALQFRRIILDELVEA